MSLLGFGSGESPGERLRQRPQRSVPELIAEIQQLYRQDALPGVSFSQHSSRFFG